MINWLRDLRAYAVIIPVCAGVFIAADDQTSIVVVLPELLPDFRIGPGELDHASWTVTGYLIGYTAAMPIMGRVSDRYGHRAVFIGALSMFMLGSALVAVSPDLPKLIGRDRPDLNWMIGARIFQAIGGGAMIPVAIASVGDVLPRARHAMAFGIIGASAEGGGVIGPLWAGLITDVSSWEWVFWINIPLGLAVIAALKFSPAGVRHPARIDFVGGALFVASLALLTAALSRTASLDAVFAVLLASAVAALLATIWWHRMVKDPLLPTRLIKTLKFTASNVAHLAVGISLITAMVTVPLMANTVLGLSPLDGGLMLLRMTVAIPFGAIAGGIWVQRWGTRWPSIAGFALAATGLAAMSRWDLDIADPEMTLHLAVAGFGFGLLIAPIHASAMLRARAGERGTASALITVSRMIGMTIGLAAIAAWGTARFDNLAGDAPLTTEGLEEIVSDGLTVFRGFFLSAAVIALLGVIPAWLMSRGHADPVSAASE
ncbi:MAG: MFS transporter [Dehalococcoidia bacterium]|nr:MFS transporter [Dehalococcoidia bacterium]